MTVWIVEDDAVILDGLRYFMLQEGYHVLASSTAAEALAFLHTETPFDFALLDVMLPDGSGYDICRKIRAKSQTPILFLTACSDEINTVMGLEMGADDYISKPFHIRELLARMKTILRRSGSTKAVQTEILHIGDNEIHTNTAKVYRDREEIYLTATEYRLLLALLNHRGQTLTRQQLLQLLWDEGGDFVTDNALTVYIRRLRRKLDDTGTVPLIATVRGIGYRLEK